MGKLTRHIDLSFWLLTGLPERALPSRREGWTARSRLVRIKIQNRQVSRANSGFAGSLLPFLGNLRFRALTQGQELSLPNKQVIEGLCSLEQKANCHHCDLPRVLVNLMGLMSGLVSYRG